MDKLILREESYSIIGACMEVHNQLGPGFLEAVYQEALDVELDLRNIPHQQQIELPIFYKEEPLLRKYRADFLCYDKVLIEIKALKAITNVEKAIALNYLKASQLPLILLVNFGEENIHYERFVFSGRLRY